VRCSSPRVLLVNPWIHDFAAYDFWARPLGLLLLGAVLRRCGVSVAFVDCLDRFHSDPSGKGEKRCFGRGAFRKTSIPKPDGMEDVPRRFSRYGIPPERLHQDLLRQEPPDLILVTSVMTYWWTGVRETISLVKEVFPSVPVILGGIYATLCAGHARRKSGADRIVTGPGMTQILDLAAALTGRSPASLKEQSGCDPEDMETWRYPALDLQRTIPYAPLLTAVGCPFACAYCASPLLSPKRMRRSPGSVLDEIRFLHGSHGVVDFALYDDAFLVDSPRHSVPILEGIIAAGLPLRFHTPNALHIREITPKTARLFKMAGFQTLRLGLETTATEEREGLDVKVTHAQFLQAAAYLREAGFHREQVGAYLLVGLPGQDLESVKESIRAVKACGIRPIPAYYSPIPQTALWKAAVASSRYPLESDPIFTNNAVFPCRKAPFSWDTVTRLKALCR